ncbi:MAG: TolC family protein [Planctomycetaceae bacterium]
MIFRSESAAARTIVELEALALEQHPSLGIAKAIVEAERGRQRQAGLSPNPIIGYRGNEMGNRGTPGMQGGFIRQRIVTGHKLKLAAGVAGRRVLERQYQVAAIRKRVISDVRIQFYETLVVQQRVELAGQLVGLGDELTKATAKLVEGEQVAANSLLQAEIEAEQAKTLLENARNELVEATRKLAATVGNVSLDVGRLEGNVTTGMSDMDWDDCRRLILEEHPQRQAARARVATTELAIIQARRQVVPDLDVRVGIGHMYPTESDVTSVMVGVPLPIFDRNQGNVSRAEAELVQARYELKRLDVDLFHRAATAFRKYANARQQARRYAEQILPRASKSLKLVRNGYRQGQVRYLVLLTTQRKYVEVNLSYLESIRRLREAVTVIESQLLTGTGASARR